MGTETCVVERRARELHTSGLCLSLSVFRSVRWLLGLVRNEQTRLLEEPSSRYRQREPVETCRSTTQSFRAARSCWPSAACRRGTPVLLPGRFSRGYRKMTRTLRETETLGREEGCVAKWFPLPALPV